MRKQQTGKHTKNKEIITRKVKQKSNKTKKGERYTQALSIKTMTEAEQNQPWGNLKNKKRT